MLSRRDFVTVASAVSLADSASPQRTRRPNFIIFLPNAHGFDRFFGFHSGCIDFYSHRYYWGEPRTVNYHDLWRNRTEVFEDGQYFTELITREAKNFVTENRTRPFFLYLPFNGVHYP